MLLRRLYFLFPLLSCPQGFGGKVEVSLLCLYIIFSLFLQLIDTLAHFYSIFLHQVDFSCVAVS